MQTPLARPPPRWHKDVILKDGTPLRLRPITPEDGPALLRLFSRLSTQTIYRRFMALLTRLDEAAVRRFTHVDYDNEVAIVGVLPAAPTPNPAPDPAPPPAAVADADAKSHEPLAKDGSTSTAPRIKIPGEEIIAVGRYVRLPNPTHAEVAFTVQDSHQGQGIGTHLLAELLPFARMAEIEVLEAEVLAQNRTMLGVFRNMGFTVSSSMSAGVVHLEFPIQETALSQVRRFARERDARAASIERLLRPKSIAVVGASERPGSFGRALVEHLLAGGYTGEVHAVNPRHSSVRGLVCHPSLLHVPSDVDLALVVVPAAEVPAVVRDCASKHVYALVVMSAGFAEIGPAGAELQQQVRDLVRSHGMRMLGPNCLGLLNTEPGVRLNGTPAPVSPPAGRVALGSQSGALGIAMLNLARDLNLGISQFVGLGNKADVSGNDLLHFWGNDPATQVVLLYLESFGNPRKFSRIARQVSATKPVVVLKSGSSSAGARAAGYHTAARADSREMVDTLLEQTGIIRTETMEQFFQAAKVLSTQPLPRGNRLAILTNAGGPAILSADRAEAVGLEVATLSDSLQTALRTRLSRQAATANPVDMIASADAADYEACLELLLNSDEVQQVLVMFIPPLVTDARAVAHAVLAAVQRSREAGMTADALATGAAGDARVLAKPVVACLMGGAEDAEARAVLEQAGTPCFRFPEDAVVALGHLSRYAAWRSLEKGDFVRFTGLPRDAVRAEILRHCDAAVQTAAAHTAAVHAAAAHTPVPHASGTAPELWLEGAEALALLRPYGLRTTAAPVATTPATTPATAPAPAAGESLAEKSAALPDAPLELKLSLHQDSHFGNVISLRLAAAYAELYEDVQQALHPLTDRDVARMLDGLRSKPLLYGYRGQPPRDVAALTDTLLRLSQLVEDHPQLRELALEPVLLGRAGEGCTVAGARLRLEPVDPFTEYVLSHLDD